MYLTSYKKGLRSRILEIVSCIPFDKWILMEYSRNTLFVPPLPPVRNWEQLIRPRSKACIFDTWQSCRRSSQGRRAVLLQPHWVWAGWALLPRRSLHTVTVIYQRISWKLDNLEALQQGAAHNIIASFAWRRMLRQNWTCGGHTQRPSFQGLFRLQKLVWQL